MEEQPQQAPQTPTMKERLLHGSRTMFNFFKKHPPKEGEEREKLKKELFNFQKCADHGFPSKPSALAYDPKLKLLAIGTKSGSIKVYGAPGVEFSGAHKNDVSVTSLFFISEEARLVSVCSDNSLHLWEYNLRSGNSVLEEVKEFSMENNKMKTISTCCLTSDNQNLLLGTEGGNIHVLNIPSFTMGDQIIYQDIVMQNVPDDFKVNPGAVEAIAVHPTDADRFLIGYNRGLVVLWDNKESKTEHTYTGTQQLESLTWNRNGEEFYSSHADGSYITWDAKDSAEPKEAAVTPYGPFPCKGINKLQWKSSKGGRFVVFSGGMPRASYGDRHTVTVMQENDTHVVFDFTSRVVDFVLLTRADETDTSDSREEKDEPHGLIILAEEEILAVDLDSVNWPSWRLPYLQSVHCSAITCAQHVLDVPDQLWQKLVDAGNAQSKSYSAREWPVSGGKNLSKPSTSKDLLITGHEDGTVKFWDVSGNSLSLLYRVATSPIFGIADHAVETPSTDDEEWPPFRKVGSFDPYSDDPRLAVQKIWLCALSETLVVAGTAGQVLVMQMEREARTQELQSFPINLMGDKDNFVWRGHEALTPTEGDTSFAAGYQPTCLMQLHPPASCTALAFHSEWQLVAVGTAHGFGLFDYAQKKQVAYRCTITVEDLQGLPSSNVSRRRSLRKSLRESFRRLRKGRTPRQRTESTKDKKETEPKEQTAEQGESATAATTEPTAESPSTEPAPAAEATPASEATSSEPAAEATPAAEAAPATETTAEVTPTAEPTPTVEATTPAPEAETTTQESAAPETTPVAEAAGATVEATPTPESAPAESETSPAPESATAAAAPAAESGSEPAAEKVLQTITDECMTSMVRCLYFADTYIINGGSNTPSLWVGTNAGHVYVYSLTVPGSDKRSSEEVGCVLAKEVKLRHRAPIISVAVIDGRNRVLPDPLEVSNERAKAPEMDGHHSVIICSEEQLKAFTLPAMKPRWKTKITSVDTTRLRRVAFVNFRSKGGDNYSEHDIVSLNNQGQLGVYSVFSLRRQMLSDALKPEDVNGISSFVFTKNGQGYYLQSPSEFSQVTLSASSDARPVCMVELKEGLRPEPPEPVVEVTPPSPTEEQPAAEQQPPEGAAGETGGAAAVAASYDTGDITVGLNDSQVNESQMETSADITVDSVRDIVTEHVSSVVSQTTTMVTTDTTVVTVTAPSPLPPDVSVESEAVEAESPHTNGPATNGTDEPSSPVDEIVDKLQEAVVVAAAAEDEDDPAVIKQKMKEEAAAAAAQEAS